MSRTVILIQLFQREQKLEQFTVVRWNNQIKMIRKFRTINPETIKKLNNVVKLSQHENILLREMFDTPFGTTTNFSQAQNQIISTLILQCIKDVQSKQNLKSSYSIIANVRQSSKDKHLIFFYLPASVMEKRD